MRRSGDARRRRGDARERGGARRQRAAPQALVHLVAAVRTAVEFVLMSNTSETFVKSMRALCADEVRLRELGLLIRSTNSCPRSLPRSPTYRRAGRSGPRSGRRRFDEIAGRAISHRCTRHAVLSDLRRSAGGARRVRTVGETAVANWRERDTDPPLERLSSQRRIGRQFGRSGDCVEGKRRLGRPSVESIICQEKGPSRGGFEASGTRSERGFALGPLPH